jgi:IS30 family transposase
MKAFVLEERKLIQDGIKRNISLSEIAREINRSKNGVVSEVRKYGGREKYNAEKAHALALKIQVKKYDKISKDQKGQPPNFNMQHRVCELERKMTQMESMIATLLHIVKNTEGKNVKR